MVELILFVLEHSIWGSNKNKWAGSFSFVHDKSAGGENA
jgi:hypothetical protein